MDGLAWSCDNVWYDLSIETGGSFAFIPGLLLLFRPSIQISPFICKDQ